MGYREMDFKPKNILMLKSHSAGIGDILRSSASWRALKDTFPQARLNLLFISNHVGYPSEKLIAKHHLIDSFYVIDKRWFNSLRHFFKALNESDKVIKTVKPDFIIDFEPYGLETTLVALIGRVKHKINSVGINEVPPRGLLYSISAPSVKKFIRKNGMEFLNYTDRDFVVLDVLGIKRDNRPIEIIESEKGTVFRESYRDKFSIPKSAKVVLANVCCGTKDALGKKVNIHLLEEVLTFCARKYNLTPVLMGSNLEIEDNTRLERMLKDKHLDVYNLTGKTDIEEVVGLINDAEIFISGDSGPYHISVALKKPTVAVFNYKETIPIHGHFHPWVRCVYAPSEAYTDEVLNAVESLLSEAR